MWEVFENCFAVDYVLLCKHELDLFVAVHMRHDSYEVTVELIGDELNAKSETLEFLHKPEEDVGKNYHDH